MTVRLAVLGGADECVRPSISGGNAHFVVHQRAGSAFRSGLTRTEPQRAQRGIGRCVSSFFMKLTIDNLLGQGAVDYTAALDVTVAPRVARKMNQPGELRCALIGNSAGFVTPVVGAHVVLTKANGSYVFTGYLTQAPQAAYVGWGEQAAVYEYNLIAESDEELLDQKALPSRAPFVARTAGSALKQLVEDLLPGCFDTSGVQDVDTLAVYAVNPQKKFSYRVSCCEGSLSFLRL